MHMQETRTAAQAYTEGIRQVARLIAAEPLQPPRASVSMLYREIVPLANHADALMNQLIEQRQQQARLLSQDTQAIYDRASVLVISLTIISALCAIVLGIVLTRWLMRQMGSEPADVDHIATGSSQIHLGHTDLAERTELQAADLSETAAAMEEITGTVRNNADSTRQAALFAARANAAVIRSLQQVRSIEETIRRMSQTSRQIEGITDLIDGIALQTKILALNAGVEAARANEQGRGFAVVAMEVQALALRSSDAAREIAGLVENSAQQTTQVETGIRAIAEDRLARPTGHAAGNSGWFQPLHQPDGPIRRFSWTFRSSGAPERRSDRSYDPTDLGGLRHVIDQEEQLTATAGASAAGGRA